MDYNTLLHNVNGWKRISFITLWSLLKRVVPSDFCFLEENFKNYHFISGIVLFYLKKNEKIFLPPFPITYVSQVPVRKEKPL